MFQPKTMISVSAFGIGACCVNLINGIKDGDVASLIINSFLVLANYCYLRYWYKRA